MGLLIKRRQAIGLAVIVAVVGGALACALALGAIPSAPQAPPPARISLAVPAAAVPGDAVPATGKVVGATAGSRVQLQAREARAWHPLGAATVRKGRFGLSFAMPAGHGLEVRAVLLEGKRTAAFSVTKHLAVRAAEPAVQSAAPSAPTGSTAAGSPVTAGSPPVAEPPATGGEEPPPTGGEEPPPVTEPPPTTNAYWGAWIGSQLTGEEAPWDMSAVTAFEEKAGKAPSLIEFGSPFADCYSSPCSYYSFPYTPFESIRARGAIPFLSWSSQSLPSTIEEPDFQLSDVAAGDYDGYVREFAEAAAAWGHPFFLRFDWEMNGNWFPWGAGVNDNTAADYVAAWRHVHQIFTEVGATNASWVWCPYVNPNSTLPDMASFYPGDGYVDWTCLDGYNWGPSAKPARTWRSFSYLFGPSYRQITETIAPAKPMLVGETASSEVGGSKAGWITNAFTALPQEFPRIQGLIWFEKEDDEMDWPIETSSTATAAFAKGIAGPRYLANSFGGLGASPIPAP
jgi:hypothetical protein